MLTEQPLKCATSKISTETITLTQTRAGNSLKTRVLLMKQSLKTFSFSRKGENMKMLNVEKNLLAKHSVTHEDCYFHSLLYKQ